MSKFKTFPRTNIHVIDQSSENVYNPEELPLHLPLLVEFTEQGVGMGYGPYSELKKQFGEGTFDSRSKWFKHPNLFLRTGAQNQPVFFYRLIPHDAKKASIVIEANVYEDEIIQYQRDSSGRFIYDSNNQPIPIVDNAPKIISLDWDNEAHTDLDNRTLTIISSDLENESLSYSISCNDSSVSITQDSTFSNMFNIIYPDYSSVRTSLKYTITVTDTAGNSTNTEMVYIINPLTTDTSFGYWWSNTNQKGNGSYDLEFITTANANNVAVTASITDNITISQDSTNFNVFHIVYGDFTTYPTDITFTSVISDTGNASNTTTFTDDKSVSENTGNTIPLKTTGLKIKWTSRELLPSESLTGLLPSTSLNGSTLITTYPIFAFTPKHNVGSYGNNIGIKLYWNRESDIDVVNDNKALLFTMELIDQPYGYDSPETVRDFYGQTFDEFMFFPNGINKSVDMRVDFDSIVNNIYRERMNLNYHVYSDNVKEIGSRVMTVEGTGISELTTEWMANIFEAISTDGVPYYNTEIDTTSSDAELMDKDIIHYLIGGDDGTVSDDNLESLAAEFFHGNVFPELKDKARWPFNHIYDSGYRLDTKYAMYDMMSLREDVHVIVSTQDVYSGYNTEAEDESAASALRIKALLYPESIIDGTNCCRVTIFQQACKINFDDTYRTLVPMTMKALLSRGEFHNATFVKGEWMGLPNASVDFIREINWAPYDDDVKQLNWDTAANYCQYYDMTRLHYPSIISVYPKLTSVLSSDTFVTYIVYLKQVVQRAWAKYVGLEEPVSLLKSKIEKDLNDTIYRKFKNYIKVVPSVYQTDHDKALGYAMTVELAVYDSVAKRLWNVPIYCRRTESLTTNK